MQEGARDGFISGGGVCGELARALDWSKTPLGPIADWPGSLRTAVGILLHSRHPMFLWWGPELVQIYNDAYLPSFGAGKHPAAMGQRGHDCWQEIWPIIKPQIDDVMERGKASWNLDQLVPIARNGRIEEVYWTYGYSPVYADDESVGGTLVVCTETTQRVVAARRLESLQALASTLITAKDTAHLYELLGTVLARAHHDIPFATLYADGRAELRDGLDQACGAILDAAVAGQLDRAQRIVLSKALPVGPWPEPVSEVLVVPVEASTRRAMVFGLSPRLPFDEGYHSFLRQLVEQFSGALSRTRVERERRNLIEHAPVAASLVVGPDHVFEIANARYVEMVGREVLGQRYVDAFPEVRDSALPEVLDRAYRTGEPYVAKEMLVMLAKTGLLREHFFDFSLEPIRDPDGEVFALMCVASDVTEQVIARRSLEQSDRERARLLAQAEVASRAKDEFLAMLGHELRNPLAPIVTALQLMELKGSDNIKREREIIARQAKHLVHLVDDLLDVSRLAQGKIEVRPERIALSEVVARAVETASPLLEKRGHELSVDVPSSGLDVDVDPVRMVQVVANLLTNAANYTPPNGQIVVRARREGVEVVLQVQDNGNGISEAQLPRLFEMFFQGPRSTDRAQGGLGLGLSLVKSLVTLHHGKVSAKSDGPGRGSEFEVRLPAATRTSSEPSAAQPITPPERPPEDRRRVLLVDDNTDLVDMLAAVLQESGFETKTAYDGPSALELATSFDPDVVIVDIGLPVMDGHEVATRLRARGGKPTRIIAMTGYGQERDYANSQRAGFDSHLVKPVNVSALVSAILERA